MEKMPMIGGQTVQVEALQGKVSGTKPLLGGD